MTNEKLDYHKTVEGNTIIESWWIDGGRNRQDQYKLKVTIDGIPQRTHSYTNEDTFLSVRMSFFMKAKRGNQ